MHGRVGIWATPLLAWRGKGCSWSQYGQGFKDTIWSVRDFKPDELTRGRFGEVITWLKIAPIHWGLKNRSDKLGIEKSFRHSGRRGTNIDPSLTA
ncbi:hypothetical protein PoB_007115200 [Plakobranchus ocellatus]|uniref:Uncharacterized protein n=1 Tax=Plakobranchus ocellatus TaxID=259542 RepID=A0AAV4DKS4_9GAST|nr:hypothetical protein PoB_007115200 [Plakobranchus ocellatus]